MHCHSFPFIRPQAYRRVGAVVWIGRFMRGGGEGDGGDGEESLAPKHGGVVWFGYMTCPCEQLRLSYAYSIVGPGG